LKTIEDMLHEMDGGRVLDVATQEGRFARTLMENLRSYTSMVGIDVNENFIERARDSTQAQGVSFLAMDAANMEFEDECFDTVAISASLHHMADVDQVLSEMRRVLKPGGRLIVLEMHRDTWTEPELTSIMLHEWAAAIDTSLGRLHNRTFTTGEILAHVDKLGMRNRQSSIHRDTDSDPMDQERLEKLREVVGLLVERADQAPDPADLAARGAELELRLSDVGAQGEPVILVTCVK
jgi:ubiquinone/menaquinone biosynthesis C-methylase UbiE